MKDECLLVKHPDMNMCCCKCKYHVEDHSHPDTDGLSILNRRGWACVGFLFCEGEAVVYSGWSEHGGCELFDAVAPMDHAHSIFAS